jgi:hypothetical protein
LPADWAEGGSNLFAIQGAIVKIISTVVGWLDGQKVLLLTIQGGSEAHLLQRSLRLTVCDLNFTICFSNLLQSGSMPLLISAIWIVLGWLHGQKILLLTIQQAASLFSDLSGVHYASCRTLEQQGREDDEGKG